MSMLKFETFEKVLLITLDDPSTFNALNGEAIEELIERLHKAEKDPNCGAIVITGNGKAFCAGADLKKFAEMPQDEIIEFCGNYGHRLFNYIATMCKPVIAAVNGYALGGGFELSLACDLRICNTRTVFSLPEFTFGWMPGWGGVVRLAKLLGSAKAKEIAFMQMKIRSEQALQLGIVSQVVEDDKLVSTAIEIGQKIAALNPVTVGTTKVLLDQMNISKADSFFQAMACSIASKMPYCRQTIQDFFDRKSKK